MGDSRYMAANAGVGLSHAPRARFLPAGQPGVSLRSTPGFMLSPAPRVWKGRPTLAIAKGSTAEVRCQLYVALDQNYIESKIFAELTGLALETGSMLGGLIKYLRRSGVKGTK